MVEHSDTSVYNATHHWWLIEHCVNEEHLEVKQSYNKKTLFACNNRRHASRIVCLLWAQCGLFVGYYVLFEWFHQSNRTQRSWRGWRIEIVVEIVWRQHIWHTIVSLRKSNRHRIHINLFTISLNLSKGKSKSMLFIYLDTWKKKYNCYFSAALWLKWELI